VLSKESLGEKERADVFGNDESEREIRKDSSGDNCLAKTMEERSS
jgi:hypothetical protein